MKRKLLKILYHYTSCFTSRTNLPQTYLYSLPYNVVIRKCQMTPTKLNLLSYMIEKFVHYIYQLYVSVVILTLGCRSSSLHAKEVSWMYQSGNKYKKFDNQVMNDFMDVSIGKQNIKIMKNIVF